MLIFNSYIGSLYDLDLSLTRSESSRVSNLIGGHHCQYRPDPRSLGQSTSRSSPRGEWIPQSP
jgi:hypothetical protein